VKKITRQILRSKNNLVNFTLQPILRRLGYQKKRQRSKGRQSHFYENQNSWQSLGSLHSGYLNSTGWVESRNNSQSTDAQGPVPWITYPSFHILKKINFSKMTILEFGAGASTLWFMAHFNKVISFEADSKYLKNFIETNKPLKNVQIENFPFNEETSENFGEFNPVVDQEVRLSNDQFNFGRLDFDKLCLDIKQFCSIADVIFIDGGPRILINDICLKFVNERTLIIVDNTDRDYEDEICVRLLNEDYIEFPFNGLGPLNPYGWTTSFFVRPAYVPYWFKRDLD
jgi:hypothetical protein